MEFVESVFCIRNVCGGLRKSTVNRRCMWRTKEGEDSAEGIYLRAMEGVEWIERIYMKI